MEEAKKVYVATNIEKHCGEEAEFFILGVFSTLEKAQEALDEQWHNDMDTLGVEEDNNDWEKMILNESVGKFMYHYGQDEYYLYDIEEKVLDA